MERTPNTISTQIQLRAEHQARAAESAMSGAIPYTFQGDPTFAELVEAKRSPKEGEGSRTPA